MARLFKDLLVQEADGKPRITLRRRDGTAVAEDVSVEVASRVQQQGDAWGALHANLLLQLSDGGVPSPRTDNPHRVTAAQAGAALANHGHTAAQVGAAPANHTHTPAQAGAAPANHVHDERYYTEAEINAMLNGKVNTAGNYPSLTAGNSAKVNGKSLSMTLAGDTLHIDWR